MRDPGNEVGGGAGGEDLTRVVIDSGEGKNSLGCGRETNGTTLNGTNVL